MNEAIFLSASVPDPVRAPRHAATADTVAITAAVSALVHVTLGRRPLVWGGHPAITPMISIVAQDIGVDYGRWVSLYQSQYFHDEFPEDNETFHNITFTPAVQGDRGASLLRMREQMFSEHQFAAGVFIGGMDGIVDEYRLFKSRQPNALIVPVISTGGATLDVGREAGPLEAELSTEFDYVALFHRQLGVSVREDRFSRPEEQPEGILERYWRAGQT